MDNFYSNLLAIVIAFLVFFLFYMVDIEIRRAKVYFSVGNRVKMGVGGLGAVKCILWGQNDVLAIRSFSFLIQRIDQNGVVLVCRGPKQRRFA